MKRKENGFYGFSRLWFLSFYPLNVATCLIALAMYGNFAFVNAAAMERRLKSKERMLHEFTWPQFLVAAAVLTLVWYGLLFLFWNLRAKAGAGSDSRGSGRVDPGDTRTASEPLPHTWEKGVDVLSGNEGHAADDLMGVSKGAEGLSRVSMDQLFFAPKVGAGSRGDVRDEEDAAEAETWEEPKAVVQAVAGAVSSDAAFLQGTVADFLEELKPVFDYASRYKKGLPVFLEHLQALLERYPEVPQSGNWEAVLEHIVDLAKEQLPFEVSVDSIRDHLEAQDGAEGWSAADPEDV